MDMHVKHAKGIVQADAVVTRHQTLPPGFDSRRQHVRWTCDHYVGQVGFNGDSSFLPHVRKHRYQ